MSTLINRPGRQAHSHLWAPSYLPAVTIVACQKERAAFPKKDGLSWALAPLRGLISNLVDNSY